MSDVSIAAPSTSLPSAPTGGGRTDIPVQVDQVSLPNPIGSQAPPKRVGDLEGSRVRPQSNAEARREAIQKAFGKQSTDVKTQRPPVTKTHNQPPEELPLERKARKAEPPAERLDLKKRPDEQPLPRERGEHGHFAPAQQPVPGHVRSGQAAASNVVQVPEQRWKQPLRRMSEAAKAHWANTPEVVQHDVHRMHHHFRQALAKYRADKEVMDTIRPFHDMARQHGTTIAHALSNYVSMEDKLRANPLAGLDTIVNNLNLRTQDGYKLNLRDIAWHIVNQSPDQHQMLQQQNMQQALQLQLQQTQARQRALEQQHAQMLYAQRFHATRSGVDRFAETHPRIDELAGIIQQEINAGWNLEQAYRRAELLRPAGHASAQAVQNRATAPQTRTQDRSISGAPGGASALNGHTRRSKPSASPRDAVLNAIRRVGSSM